MHRLQTTSNTHISDLRSYIIVSALLQVHVFLKSLVFTPFYASVYIHVSSYAITCKYKLRADVAYTLVCVVAKKGTPKLPLALFVNTFANNFFEMVTDIS